ncbi:MAG: hypothetical protein ACRYGI_02090 [Janthinobacterium lividum]
MSKTLIDIREDLRDLAEETSVLREQILLYKADVASQQRVRELLSKSGLAATVTKLYTGCEKLMEILVGVVDKEPIGHGAGGWHAQLLKRMSQPYADIRDPVISTDLFDRMNSLRAFRHRERHSYAQQLDGSIVAERAEEMAEVACNFKAEVEIFLNSTLGKSCFP